jgi:hypothetical protein
MKRNYLFLYFLLVTLALKSQKENSKWYFGYHCALDFSASGPTVLPTSSIYAAEGSASIADSSGNLLFYTSGDTVWNSLHNVMANGDLLLGKKYASQPAIIVQQPGSASNYYVFTLDHLADTNGFRYSVVDMSLAAGLGSVTAKNVMIYRPAVEKLTAVKHANGQDMWIVTHEFNTNNFRSYLLTAAGLNTVPVITSLGPIHGPSIHGSVGCMKASVNGRKIGLALSNILNTIELYDFNNATGVLSNQLGLGVTAAFYGCEFSPDGTKFYGSALNKLYQWNLCAGSNALIVASQYSVAATPYQMEMAADGKIYVATNTATIGIINNPNAGGAGCNYNNSGLVLSANSSYGMPNMVSYFYKNKLNPIGYTKDPNVCGKITFTSPCMSQATHTSVLWNFGDAGSASNTSNLISPVHIYPTSGTYTVKLTMNASFGTDSAIKVISLQIPTVNIVSSFQVICPGQPVSLTATGANNYIWSTGSNSPSIIVAPLKTTTYTVTGISDCSVQKTHTVTVKCGVGINDFEGNINSVKIYPNPSDGSFVLENNVESKVIIYDLSGRALLEKRFVQGEHQLDLTKLSAGIYILQSASVSEARHIKMIIRK